MLPAALPAPGRNLDLVAIRIVEIEGLDRHERVLSAADLESQARETLPLVFVVLWSDLQANVVQRTGAHQRLLGCHRPRNKHHLLRHSVSRRADSQELDRQRRWR